VLVGDGCFLYAEFAAGLLPGLDPLFNGRKGIRQFREDLALQPRVFASTPLHPVINGPAHCSLFQVSPAHWTSVKASAVK
jgi:hypothetical protein